MRRDDQDVLLGAKPEQAGPDQGPVKEVERSARLGADGCPQLCVALRFWHSFEGSGRQRHPPRRNNDLDYLIVGSFERGTQGFVAVNE